jgi:hypothetical protein
LADRRQLLLRNLAFGAAVGGGIGLVQAVSGQARHDVAAVLGMTLGGALGGAVIFVLASALWLAIVRRI